MRAHVQLSKYILYLTVFFVFVGPQVQAQSASSRVAEPLPAIVVESSDSRAMTVIEGDALTSVSSVGEALRQIPGLTVTESGGLGQPVFVLIRGAPSGQTVVLFDGFEVNDASGTDRAFDFANLSTGEIERIEIYRGTEALAFGPYAANGVINLVPRRGTVPRQWNYMLEGGSHSTRREHAGLSGVSGRFSYALNGGEGASEGFSAARGGAEADGMRRFSLYGRLGWDFTERSGLDFVYRGLLNRTELDSGGGPVGDDPNYISALREHTLAFSYRVRSFNGRLRSSWRLTQTRSRRAYDNAPDPVHLDDYHEVFRARRDGWETRQEYRLSPSQTLEGVLQWQREQSESKQALNGWSGAQGRQSHTQFGQALIYKLRRGALNFLAGGRFDQVTHGGQAFTHSFSPAYTFGNTTWRVGRSNGFRSPSLYQLYSSFGRTDLRSEHTESTEISMERRFSSALLSITGFVNNYRELIDFDPGSLRYKNISRGRAEGIETQGQWDFDQFPLNLKLSHTYLETRDEVRGGDLLRRPRHSWSASAHSSFGQRCGAELRVRYVGARSDIDPVTFQRLTLPPHAIFDAGFSYRVFAAQEIRLRVENLFDRSYENVAGFGASRFALYVSLARPI